jgi:hypothetical protein
LIASTDQSVSPERTPTYDHHMKDLSESSPPAEQTLADEVLQLTDGFLRMMLAHGREELRPEIEKLRTKISQ